MKRLEVRRVNYFDGNVLCPPRRVLLNLNTPAEGNTKVSPLKIPGTGAGEEPLEYRAARERKRLLLNVFLSLDHLNL